MNGILLITRKLPYDSGVIVSVRHLEKILRCNGVSARVYEYETEEELVRVAVNSPERAVDIHVPAFSDEALEKIMSCGKRIMLSIHSTICNLQAEEGMLERIFTIGKTYGDRLQISCPSRREKRGMNAFSSGRFVYLPNTFSYPIIPYEDAIVQAEERMERTVKKLACFCAYRPFKNLPTQIAAVALASNRHHLELQFSAGSDKNPLYRTVHTLAERAGLPSVTWPQKTNREFYNSLDGVSLLLQVSLSETLSYVALEHMVRGIPVIGSNSIPFATVTADYSDVTDIAEKICEVLEPDRYMDMVKRSYVQAERLVWENNAAAVEVMRQFLGSEKKYRGR